MQQHHFMLIKLHVQLAKKANVMIVTYILTHLELQKSKPSDRKISLFELLGLFKKFVF